MDPVAIAFVVVNAVALLMVPRRWAPLPLLLTACYLSLNEVVEVGPLSFTALRLLIGVGVLRVLLRAERLTGGLNGLDRLMLALCAWAVISGLFHEDPSSTFVNRLGLVYNLLGIYMLIRVFCRTPADVVWLATATAVILVPVALEMAYEVTGRPSLFYAIGGEGREVYIRQARVRAVGPFMHPILAGTVGAVCLPLMVGLWRERRAVALIGTIACLTIVGTSASSGPVMSTAASVAGLGAWAVRGHMRAVRRLSLGLYLALALAMQAPVYYLMARVNVVGGSTGYHRALLIESALTHLGDWWATGTDVTRHWAPSPGFTPQHTDITNQYLSLGVLGGLPMIALYLAVLAMAFAFVGRGVRETTGRPGAHQFMIWGLGSALFGHAVTGLSVTYFDQSFLFLYVTIAAIGSTRLSEERAVSQVSQVPIRISGRSGEWQAAPRPATTGQPDRWPVWTANPARRHSGWQR